MDIVTSLSKHLNMLLLNSMIYKIIYDSYSSYDFTISIAKTISQIEYLPYL